MEMTFSVTTATIAGREGKYVHHAHIRDRLLRETGAEGVSLHSGKSRTAIASMSRGAANALFDPHRDEAPARDTSSSLSAAGAV
jgi:hypothetical protein